MNKSLFDLDFGLQTSPQANPLSERVTPVSLGPRELNW